MMENLPVSLIRTIIAAGVAAAVAVPAFAADISGAGASFPYPVYAKWAAAYKGATGNGVNYQSIGSGGGIKQVTARTVTFGASDMPLKPEQLDKDGLIQFPTVLGGVVPVVNLDGIGNGDLTLDGATLARIYLGEIKSWDDPAIKALNPNAKLPAQAIALVHRSDGSGTTFVFTNYLSSVSDVWKSKVGASTAVQWPAASGIGAKGNEGVANNVKQTRGAIGYVETAYAKQSNLSATKLVNKDGKAVTATAESIAAAAAGADWSKAPGYYLILTNEAGAETWPIAAATFILIPKKPKSPADARIALQFFDWAYNNGGQSARDLDYVPLPESVVTLIRQTWSAEVKDADGKAVYTPGN
jgi:phosphate transport system substrate-binding protein